MGWLALACPPTREIHYIMHKYNRGRGTSRNELYCPGEQQDVSPFHAFEYVVHRKDLKGVIHTVEPYHYQDS